MNRARAMTLSPVDRPQGKANPLRDQAAANRHKDVTSFERAA